MYGKSGCSSPLLSTLYCQGGFKEFKFNFRLVLGSKQNQDKCTEILQVVAPTIHTYVLPPTYLCSPPVWYICYNSWLPFNIKTMCWRFFLVCPHNGFEHISNDRHLPVEFSSPSFHFCFLLPALETFNVLLSTPLPSAGCLCDC